MRVEPERLLQEAAKAVAFTALLKVPAARLGLRHLALVSLAGRSLRRALVLSEAATRLPVEVVLNLTPVGEKPSLTVVERVSDQAGWALAASGLVGGEVRGKGALRPWRAVMAVLEGGEIPEETRHQALRWAVALDEPGAWLAFSYLKLAVREDMDPDRVVRGLVPVLGTYQLLMRPGRKRWWPWNPEGKGRVDFSGS